jgi:hypothetical protein
VAGAPPGGRVIVTAGFGLVAGLIAGRREFVRLHSHITSTVVLLSPIE